MKKPFRIRSKKAILQAVQRRLYLISASKSKSFVTYDHCTGVREQLNTLNSDRQMVEFVLKNQDLIANIIAANNHKAAQEFRYLAEEARILEKSYKDELFKITITWKDGEKQVMWQRFSDEKEARFALECSIQNYGMIDIEKMS